MKTGFALVDKADAVLRVVSFDGKPEDLPHKGWRWLPVVDAVPDYDRSTQSIEADGWIVADGTATRTYATKVRQRSLEERLTALEARVAALDGK